MNQYRYILEKGSKKHICPTCNKRRFVRYIDKETGDYLPEIYGRCDRENNCPHNENPYSDGYAKEIWKKENGYSGNSDWKPKYVPQVKPRENPKPVFFDFDTFEKNLKDYEQNDFIQNLLKNIPFPFIPEDVVKVRELYQLGTISKGYLSGAITFPFIDINQNVRAVQVKQFDKKNKTIDGRTSNLHSIIKDDCKRNKKDLPEWLQLYINYGKYFSCLFGEHLLTKFPNQPIALVEAPKTAIYGTLYYGFPEQPDQPLWLAVYNRSSFTFDRIKVLQGRTVHVFPDLSKDGSTFKMWEERAKEMERKLTGTRFKVHDILERIAPEIDRVEGNDIADYLMKIDWRKFRKASTSTQSAPKVELEEIHTKQNKHPDREQLNANIKKLTPLHWRHLQNIPLEVKKAVVNARVWGKLSKEELHKKFNLSIEEINLILYPNGRGLVSA